MLIKKRTSQHTNIVNETRLCACKLKYLLLWLVNLEFFFFFDFLKKMGQSGNGKCNILLGWPKVPYHDYSISLSPDC